jgi:hypothetical protein
MDIKYEYRKRRDKFYILWVAKILPKRLVLWCFIAVCGADGGCPDPMYSRCYGFWKDKYNLKDM